MERRDQHKQNDLPDDKSVLWKISSPILGDPRIPARKFGSSEIHEKILKTYIHTKQFGHSFLNLAFPYCNIRSPTKPGMTNSYYNAHITNFDLKKAAPLQFNLILLNSIFSTHLSLRYLTIIFK